MLHHCHLVTSIHNISVGMYTCHLIEARLMSHSFIKLVDLLSVFIHPYSDCTFLLIKDSNKMLLFSSMRRFHSLACNILLWSTDLKGITLLWNSLPIYSSVLPHLASYKIKVFFLFKEIVKEWIFYSFKTMILTSPLILIFLFFYNKF